MRKSLTYKSVPCFWDLPRTSSLINIELILLGFVLDVFELFELWVLIRARNFTRAVIKLTHIILKMGWISSPFLFMGIPVEFSPVFRKCMGIFHPYIYLLKCLAIRVAFLLPTSSVSSCNKAD